MKDKITVAIMVVALLSLMGIQQYFIFTSSSTNRESLLLKKIESLEVKLDSLNNNKDSIRTIIDSTHFKIITNEKHYQERINTYSYIPQPISSDSGYISNYIGRYIESHQSYFQVNMKN